mgnify:FL=1|jgi:hypothetical protein
MSMNKEQNMALVDLAIEHDRLFIYFLKGWIGVDNHEEMAKCARSNMKYSEEGKKLLAEFDTTLDKTLETEV